MTPPEISPAVETHIVELSLQHPEYGARRLVPLLEQENILLTASTVYAVLKRNNLQNKTLRLLRLEEQRAVEMAPAPAGTVEPTKEEPVPVPAHTIETKPESPESWSIKSLSRFSGRRFWTIALPTFLILGLVGYFFISAALELLQVGRETIVAPQPAPAGATSEALSTDRPLEDYNIIFERNLFGAAQGQVSVPQEEVSVEDVPAADKSLGLKLVGTVAGDDSATSFAIISNKKTRKQEIYQEGDKAGNVLIKKILRNNVIVDGGRGEELLALELEETGKKVDFSPASQAQLRTRGRSPREKAQQFDRTEVEAALGSVDQVIQQLNISPYMRYGRPAGFRIGKLPADSILVAMGLRTGDLIMGVNDQAITGPEQAAEFIQKLKQGGDVTIKVGKGRGVRLRGRVIRLKIE